MIKYCPECGIPKRITKEHSWSNNGVIEVKREAGHRMLYFEPENIKVVFKNIEDTLGSSIEHIVIESQRRFAYGYLSRLVPDMAKKMIRITRVNPFIRNMTSLGKIMGLGDIRLVANVNRGKEDEHSILRIRQPWFLPAICGVIAGGTEAEI